MTTVNLHPITTRTKFVCADDEEFTSKDAAEEHNWLLALEELVFDEQQKQFSVEEVVQFIVSKKQELFEITNALIGFT